MMALETSEGKLSVREEQQLIRATQAGCARSARRLIEFHQQRLHAFVWRMVRNAHDAEEVCQEAFLRAFGALTEFDFNYRFSTWLFTIAYRLCLNLMRRRRDFAGDVDLGQVSSSQRGEPGPAEEAPEEFANSDEARRLKGIIWDAVETLSAPQRAAVLLFYREGMSCQQISGVLEMPAATVKSHLHRARARLKESLQDRLSDDWSQIRFTAESS